MVRFRGKYGWLSNMYECEIVVGGDRYWSVEAAFQSCKCKNAADRKLFIENRNPVECKKLGRKVEMRDDWEKVKVNVMCWLLYAKFSNAELKHKLLSIDDELLVEENDWGDRYWGVCNGNGLNMLGKCLKKVKHRLMKEEV